MIGRTELLANGLNAASIVLAGRNSVHTWWTGIAGCLLFAVVFFQARLYADVTLQAFFVGASVAGWVKWQARSARPPLPVRYVSGGLLAVYVILAVVVTVAYAAALRRFTDAYAPLADSAVLSFSVLGQLLLVSRRVESWWCWVLVNTVSVPLYLARGLYVTAALYVLYWVNAWVSLVHWRHLARGAPGV